MFVTGSLGTVETNGREVVLCVSPALVLQPLDATFSSGVKKQPQGSHNTGGLLKLSVL